MKKSILLGLLLSLFTGHISAQTEGFYGKLGAGYQFAAARQATEYNNDVYTTGFHKKQFITKHSLQKGFAPLAAVGYMFNKNIGVEIGAAYCFGSTSEVNVQFKSIDRLEDHKLYLLSRSVMITPSLRLVAPLSKKISIYSRSGLVIPVLSDVKKLQTIRIEDVYKLDKFEADWVLKNHFALGLSGALGVAYKVAEKVCFNVEVAGQMLNLWAKNEKLKSLKLNGVEIDRSQYSYYNFNDLIYDEVADGTKGHWITYQSPFHSLGINAGLAINF